MKVVALWENANEFHTFLPSHYRATYIVSSRVLIYYRTRNGGPSPNRERRRGKVFTTTKHPLAKNPIDLRKLILPPRLGNPNALSGKWIFHIATNYLFWWSVESSNFLRSSLRHTEKEITLLSYLSFEVCFLNIYIFLSICIVHVVISTFMQLPSSFSVLFWPIFFLL